MHLWGLHVIELDIEDRDTLLRDWEDDSKDIDVTEEEGDGGHGGSAPSQLVVVQLLYVISPSNIPGRVGGQQ